MKLRSDVLANERGCANVVYETNSLLSRVMMI